MANRTGVLREFLMFCKENKAYWMVPIIIALLLLAVLVILGATGAGSFIYTLG